MSDTVKDLTIAEMTLARILAAQTEVATRAVWRDGRYDEPTDAERAAMSETQQDAIMHVVAGMREPAVCPPSIDDLRMLIRGLAEGAVLKVLGSPPESRAMAN